jgi:hypothetical protein
MNNVERISKLAGNRAGFCRAIRHSSFVILLGVLFLLLPRTGFGQSSNRWLFVFNTSAAMRDRVKGVAGVAQDLLTTAMHGNLRSGDTIGIWTYDSVLRADEAPLLTWDPDSAPAIFQHMQAFIGRHPYQKTAAFGGVLTNMLRVIKDSDVITVILISDGSDSITGTPFDAKLNAFYKENERAQKKANMPIVTIFRGEHGVVTTNTAALAPWPADIPAVPPPVIAKAAPKPVEAPKPPPPVVPPLIVVGSKVETPAQYAVTEAEESKAADAKAEMPVAAPAPAPAPKVVPEEKPATPVAPAVETPKPQIETQVTNTPAVSEVMVATNQTASNQPAVETAAVPAHSVFSARNLGIVSVAFAALICGLLILTARRARSQSQASLITRSLDREGK